MNRKIHHILALAIAALLTACTDQEVHPDGPTDLSGKAPIELSVGGVDAPAMTRAVVTDGTTNTTFGRDTKVFMLMQSDKDATTHDGYEYKGSRANTLYTVARANVVHATSPTNIVFDNTNKKYWDDAHARSSQLTIWAFAQRIATDTDKAWPTYSFQSYNGSEPSLAESYKKDYNSATSYGWFDNPKLYPAIFSWWVGNGSANQDANTLIYQDLFFSNNIANYVGNEKVPVGSRTDNRMKFNFTTHKFPASTELKFYHAMSKITIQLKAGKGFKADGSDFKLKNNTVDLLHGFNTRGLFNIKDGEFQMIHEYADITSIPLTKTVVGTSEPYYTLEALAIPNIHQFLKTHSGTDENSRFLDGSSVVMMEITVDDNTYKITSNDLFDAITGKTNATTLTDNGTYVPLEAGKNYVFTFTIGKQEIDNLTAQVAEWETVTANEQTPTNARIKLQLEERGTAQTSDVAFWKANDNKTTDGIDDDYTTWNWKTGYTNLNATYSSDHWTTNYFWQSNKDFYHFRALMPAATGVTTDGSGDGDYATLTSAASYTDVRWGAPMKDDGDDETAGSFTWTYDPTTNGFDNTGHTQIYKAIGPTKDAVKLILFHMMSDLTFNIKTTGGTDAVTLVNGGNKTKVEIVGFYPDGKVLLGNGLVQTTGSTGTQEVAWNSESPSGTHVYKYGAVPQDLTNVVLVITTPDHNQYKVKLWDAEHPITATVTNHNLAIPYAESSTAGKYLIDRWYPGFKYTYSFTLAKTGITNLQATIVDWETVTADDETVKIQ